MKTENAFEPMKRSNQNAQGGIGHETSLFKSNRTGLVVFGIMKSTDAKNKCTDFKNCFMRFSQLVFSF